MRRAVSIFSFFFFESIHLSPEARLKLRGGCIFPHISLDDDSLVSCKVNMLTVSPTNRGKEAAYRYSHTRRFATRYAEALGARAIYALPDIQCVQANLAICMYIVKCRNLANLFTIARFHYRKGSREPRKAKNY